MEAWFGPARVSNQGSRRSGGGGAHPLNESRISNARESAWYACSGSKCDLSIPGGQGGPAERNVLVACAGGVSCRSLAATLHPELGSSASTNAPRPACT